MHSIEAFAYGISKDLVSEKEEIKCKNMIKRYKKWLTLMMLQKETQKNIFQIGRKFLIIHAEYQEMEALDLKKQIQYLI